MQGPVLVDAIQQQLPQMDKTSSDDHHHLLLKQNVIDFMEHPPCSKIKGGEFPPPLPSLARKSYRHLPLQVPWCLLQANRSNNRVVLHEVKVPQQMLFQPIRKQGRLVLHMLRQDSDDEEAEDLTATSPSTATTRSLSTLSTLSSGSIGEVNSEIDEIGSV